MAASSPAAGIPAAGIPAGRSRKALTPRDRAERRAAILDLLAAHGRLTVTEAVAELGVSEATVRRDFTDLAAEQLANRTHGGIVASAVAYELPYRYRTAHRFEELDRIAAATAALIEPGQVVACNGGTTTTAVARAVTSRADLAAASERLTLVTNALNIATEVVLRPHVQVVSLGGVARPESYEVSGPLAQLVVEQLWFDVAVVGVVGLSRTHGATCHTEDEAAIVRAMIDRAQRTLVVAAGEKLGRRGFASICPLDTVDVLVTTAPESHPEVRAARAAGIEVHCV